MKEFEQWWKNKTFNGYHGLLKPDDYFDRMTPEDKAEEIWWAALELTEQWYKDLVIAGPSNGLYLYRKKIRQELEERE